MSKGWKITAIVLAVLLTVGVAAGITTSVMTLQAMNNFVEEQKKAQEPAPYTEDDVTIAEEYEIKSTLPISDAYKSGDTSALSEKEKEVLDMASGILDEIITEGMSDYEKEKAVYDWMCKELTQDTGLLTVIPTSGADSDNPYGVLKFHQAVCVGYATTFRLFMQMMDIECMVIHNTACYHSWDLVKIDGDWYHTDIYSDSGRGDYSHFNMTDAMKGQAESWEPNFYPEANSVKYNVGFQNVKEAETVYDIPKLVREAMDAEEMSFTIHFAETVDEGQAQIGQAIMNQIETRLGYGETVPIYLGSYQWLQNDAGEFVYWVCLYKSDYNNSNISDLDEATYAKIAEEIDASFGDIASSDMYNYEDGELAFGTNGDGYNIIEDTIIEGAKG